MSEKRSWQNRYKITATLTTTAPLHIGGDLPVKKDIYPKADRKKKIENVEVTAIVTGGHEQMRAYLPGSTLKGNIRAWMEVHGADKKTIEEIFGSEHTKTKEQRGGKVEFGDAFWDGSRPACKEDPPYWDNERLTGITASVAIDRQTGTASDKKLFHREFVPAGVSFGLCITGQDMDKDEAAALGQALAHGFAPECETPVTLGTATADGWGRFALTDLRVIRMEREEVAMWLQNPAGAGYGILDQAFQDVTGAVMSRGKSLFPLLTAGKRLVIDLTLRFDGPFLVNDPSKSKKVLGDDHQADFNPRLDHQGKVTLPASSFRGALRTQAERILRTIGDDACACTPARPCAAITNVQQVEKLCPACRLFGAAGWRTALEMAPFRLVENSHQPFEQEFVAIDRFTGGAREGAKFRAKAVLSPVFAGQLSVDLERVSEPWALGLLALTLRDLCEGDISFGFGASKGYGACTAEATVSSHPGFIWPPGEDNGLTQLVAALHTEITRRGGRHEQ